MSRAMQVQTAALLLAAWLGASLITVAVVAPGAFAVLPSRTMAGTMVGRVLPALFIAGIVIGVVVAGIAAMPPTSGAGRGAMATALLSAVACAFAQFWITPKLDRLRVEIGGPVDALSPEDPRRVAFGLFHGYNVAGLGVAMLGAAVCLCFLVYAMRPRT
jgi:Domain of unknown function (DUF4149)